MVESSVICSLFIDSACSWEDKIAQVTCELVFLAPYNTPSTEHFCCDCIALVEHPIVDRFHLEKSPLEPNLLHFPLLDSFNLNNS